MYTEIPTPFHFIPGAYDNFGFDRSFLLNLERYETYVICGGNLRGQIHVLLIWILDYLNKLLLVQGMLRVKIFIKLLKQKRYHSLEMIFTIK